MSENNSHSNWYNKSAPYLWLLLGCVALAFTNGRFLIPNSALIAHIFLLQYFRSRKRILGAVLAVPGITLALVISWSGIAQDSGLNYAITAVIMTCFSLLPFLVDRLLFSRLPLLPASLVFPATFTFIDFLSSRNPDVGTYTTLAHNQFGNLALMQVVSLTGIWGMIFLLTWVPSMFSLAWRNSFQASIIKTPLLVCGGIMALVIGFGEIRLAFFKPGGPTVQVASVTVRSDLHEDFATNLRERKLHSLQKNITVLNEHTRQAARAGAKFIVWQEAAAYLKLEDTQAYIKAGQKLARKEQVYLLLSLMIHKQNQKSENRSVFIDPGGEIKYSYKKHYLDKHVEEPYTLRGTKTIPIVQTPYGRVASVICFDADHPGFIRELGSADVDLLLIPSFDWDAINPLHTHMAVFRALENGFSLVRAVGNGLSASFDSHGRTLAVMDYDNSRPEDRILYSYVPIKGTPTLYSRIGDLFAWLCLLGLCTLIYYAYLRVGMSSGKNK